MPEKISNHSSTVSCKTVDLFKLVFNPFPLILRVEVKTGFQSSDHSKLIPGFRVEKFAYLGRESNTAFIIYTVFILPFEAWHAGSLQLRLLKLTDSYRDPDSKFPTISHFSPQCSLKRANKSREM